MRDVDHPDLEGGGSCGVLSRYDATPDWPIGASVGQGKRSPDVGIKSDLMRQRALPVI